MLVRLRTDGAYVTRARAEEYRRLAQECRAAAHAASSAAARTVLIEQAESWTRLAKQQDEEGANVVGPGRPS